MTNETTCPVVRISKALRSSIETFNWLEPHGAPGETLDSLQEIIESLTIACLTVRATSVEGFAIQAAVYPAARRLAGPDGAGDLTDREVWPVLHAAEAVAGPLDPVLAAYFVPPTQQSGGVA